MRVNDMILNGNWLVLVLDNPREAAQILDGFQAGEYKLSRQKKARSLDANAYCWELINTEQMSRLIDTIVQECRQLGIETRPQEEIDSLLGKWGRKHG